MFEKFAAIVLGSDWFWAAVVALLLKWILAWWLTATGAKWRKYEGYAITAVKAAEKAIPDGTPYKGLKRLDKALQLFLEKYTAATGVTPNEKALGEIESLLNVIHARLESNDQL